jgi:hypothetical protein
VHACRLQQALELPGAGQAELAGTDIWKAPSQPVVYTQYHMRELLRFFWNSTRGHRLAPWRSPYLRWRMETYSGLKMDKIGFVEFWGFMVRERKQLRRFLKWTAEMDNYARPKPKNP